MHRFFLAAGFGLLFAGLPMTCVAQDLAFPHAVRSAGQLIKTRDPHRLDLALWSDRNSPLKHVRTYLVSVDDLSPSRMGFARVSDSSMIEIQWRESLSINEGIPTADRKNLLDRRTNSQRSELLAGKSARYGAKIKREPIDQAEPNRLRVPLGRFHVWTRIGVKLDRPTIREVFGSEQSVIQLERPWPPHGGMSQEDALLIPGNSLLIWIGTESELDREYTSVRKVPINVFGTGL